MTARQRQVLSEVVAHGSRKEAAACLGISDNTARQHLSLLFRALGAANTIEAVVRLGWLRLPADGVQHRRVA